MSDEQWSGYPFVWRAGRWQNPNDYGSRGAARIIGVWMDGAWRLALGVSFFDADYRIVQTVGPDGDPVWASRWCRFEGRPPPPPPYSNDPPPSAASMTLYASLQDGVFGRLVRVDGWSPTTSFVVSGEVEVTDDIDGNNVWESFSPDRGAAYIMYQGGAWQYRTLRFRIQYVNASGAGGAWSPWSNAIYFI